MLLKEQNLIIPGTGTLSIILAGGNLQKSKLTLMNTIKHLRQNHTILVQITKLVNLLQVSTILIGQQSILQRRIKKLQMKQKIPVRPSRILQLTSEKLLRLSINLSEQPFRLVAAVVTALLVQRDQKLGMKLRDDQRLLQDKRKVTRNLIYIVRESPLVMKVVTVKLCGGTWNGLTKTPQA